MSKFYYFIEDLDITNDNIPDGVLIRQFKIDLKKNMYIYTKNNYISKELLMKILDDILKSKSKIDVKPILVSHKVMNNIKNKMVPLDEVPRVIISKTSYFAHLLHKKPIDINKLVKDLNKIFK
jgi:hypothetical protein